MAWRVYKSTDVGAPVLSGTTKSCIALLDAVLTGPSFNGTGNAYGSIPCAGWRKLYEDVAAPNTTRAVYRPGPGNSRMYYRVVDDGSLAQGAREASVRGYESMSDVDTGTDPFPTVAQASNGDQIAKSSTLDAVARKWVIGADERTCVVFVDATGGGTYQGTYFGEFFTYKAGDTFAACVIGGRADGAVNNSTGTALATRSFVRSQYNTSTTSVPTVAGCYICRHHDGVTKSVACTTASSTALLTDESQTPWTGQVGWGFLPKTNAPDNAVYIAFNQLWYELALRGYLRGIGYMCHRSDVYTDLEPVFGNGALAGRNFIAVHVYSTRSIGYASLMALETSDTVD